MAEHDTSHPESAGSAPAPVSDRLIDAALGLAGERGWRGLTMAAIADRAGIPLNEALKVHGSRNAVLRAMGEHVDAAMLDEALSFTEEDGARDRLFDMLMRRYDALARWKPGLAAIIKDLPFDPGTFVVSMQGVQHSMGLALEAASLSGDGLGGLATRQGLAAVYLATMRVWINDDTADLSQTMAALDKNLDRADSVASTVCRVVPCRERRRRDDGGRVEPAPDADPAWTAGDDGPAPGSAEGGDGKAGPGPGTAPA
ncbi:TetR/AcrR family transcriptional regulator [Roseospira goensis]|uniref:AcrR family transcriptional regulator n=1 Tax=Roseospira goensis TaxID=391922 RepID=A0A7W6WLK6_9PROT|nr:TetR/AcrR family transcriptional regulator [Roseospira goensis]MBB4287190.1 AcrR family transcriptional regulator [Roseospira goensis]